MKRRSFLKSAASAFPIVLAEPFAVAAQPSDSPQKEIRPVLSGEDRFGKNWSRGYSRILFKNSTQETSGNFFVIEHDNLISGGPPVHIHLEQEEWFYVMEGEVLFQIGEKRLRLKAGDSILGPRRIPHAFSPVGAEAGKDAHRFLSSWQDGAVLPRYSRPEPAGAGCGLLSQVRDGARRASAADIDYGADTAAIAASASRSLSAESYYGEICRRHRLKSDDRSREGDQAQHGEAGCVRRSCCGHARAVGRTCALRADDIEARDGKRRGALETNMGRRDGCARRATYAVFRAMTGLCCSRARCIRASGWSAGRTKDWSTARWRSM